jgi:CBS domain-containing protein
MRQAMEKMEYHGLTAVPLIDKEGKYAGTLTEGDLLRKIKNTPDFTFSDSEKITVAEIPRNTKNEPVRIEAKISDLLTLAVAQNFIPVVDDEGIFIGIIRRREIIEFYAGKANINESKDVNPD